MTCQAIADHALEFIEGELPPADSQEVNDHLTDCLECRQRIQQTRELVDGMGAARSIERAQYAATSVAQPFPIARELAHLAVLGDFEIIDKLGQGGMGVVYRARQVSLNREVALKVLPTSIGGDDESIARFHREAQAAARLHHTNIVPIYAEGHERDRFYYAMELIHGRSLAAVLAEESETRLRASSTGSRSTSSRDFKRVARLVAEVAEALHHAHQQGVVHRDIKPHNLMLGNDDRLHITDFGLARLLDQPGMTLTGDNPGTPAYMAPEQVLGQKNIDGRTDVYSLGVTLYEMLAHQRPFSASTRDGVLQQVLRREPKPPRKIDQRIPQDLETICLRAMDKQPQRRFQTAHDFAVELRRYAADYPIVSRRIGPLQRVIRWTKRHPAGAGLIATAALSIGVWTMIAHRLTESERQRQADARRHEIREANARFEEAWQSLLNDYQDQANIAKAKELMKDGAATSLAEPRAVALVQAFLDGRATERSETEAGLKRLESFPNDSTALTLRYWLAAILADGDPASRTRFVALDRDIAGLRTFPLDDIEAIPSSSPSSALASKIPEDYFFIGMALMKYDSSRAYKALSRAIDLKPAWVQALVHQGRAANTLMFETGDIASAESVAGSFETLCNKLKPNGGYEKYLYSINCRLRALHYRAVGKETESRKLFQQALELARAARDAIEPTPNGYAAEAEYWEALGDNYRALHARFELFLSCTKGTKFEKVKRLRALDTEFYDYASNLAFGIGDDALAYNLLHRVTAKRPAGNEPPPHKQPADARAGFVLLESLIRRSLGQEAEARITLTRRGAPLPLSAHERLLLEAAFRLSGFALPADHWAGAISTNEELPGALTESFLYELIRYFHKELLWELLDAQADRQTDHKQRQAARAAAWFYRGVRELEEGRRADALCSFSFAADIWDSQEYSTRAKFLLRRMTEDPIWPYWKMPESHDSATARAP